MYVTYDDTGTITATIIGPDETYGEILDRDGRKWIFVERESLDPRFNHVCPVDRVVKQHTEMPIEVSKTTIAADGKDSLTISGIPSGAVVQAFCDGTLQASEIVTDGHIEFSTLAPAEYTFGISCARHLPFTVEVTAI